MKPFIWKFLVCIIPCLLAIWVTTDATVKYYRGDSGGFKLGVDLVGGTILVYEIDLRKNQQDTENKFDPVRDINVLAESLKRRIDPNDLYNITIRPAGGEGRIEIILPTGGTHRAKKADQQWYDLLRVLEDKDHFDLKDRKLEVGRGKILELADQIQSYQSETLWSKQLFSDAKSWERLREEALKNWARIDNRMTGDKEAGIAPDEQLKKDFLAINPGDLEGFSQFVVSSLAGTPFATTRKSVQAFIKKQAWEETLTKARVKWLYTPWSEKAEFERGAVVVKDGTVYRSTEKNKNDAPPGKSWLAVNREDEPYREEMERISPDAVDQVTTFVLAKGSVVGQSALSLLKPLVGEYLERVFDDDNDPKAKDVKEFIYAYYGRPAQEIIDTINTELEKTGQAKDLSVEEVQRIKDLVSKVGSLEFRILANGGLNGDDTAAIEDMKKLYRGDPTIGGELKEAKERGLPPPTLREGKQPKAYDIKTARGEKSRVTYSWVELGPQERKALNLDNAARTDAQRSAAWFKAAAARGKNEPTELPDFTGRSDSFLLQGALFFSRKCEDRNLPDDERRKKEFEYFVLTRDPEFDPKDLTRRTPKIDGSYLVNAYGAPGSDLRPTVHFSFNTAGGELFGNITRKNVSEGGGGPEGSQRRRHLAIILDGMVMSAPTINSPIYTQGQISGNFTQKEVDALVNILRAGRLPATLKPQPVSESTIAATLGEDTIASGVQAILLAFGAVLLFMMVYYRFAGLVASIALFANLLLTVGFMVAVQATFTLSGLAGIVLTLGMAVDANVLIYERLREERERGATLLQAIRNGYDRALPTIIDTHLSSIFTAIVLYVVGNDNLKGFAVSMTVGLVISLFTSLYMTRLMFDFWQEKGWLTKLSMMRLFAKPDIDFMSIRNAMFAITIVLSVVGAALFIGRLPNDLNIDFRGGTAYGGKLKHGLKIQDLRKLVDEKHMKETLKDVQITEVAGGDSRRYDFVFPNGDNKPHTVSFNNVPEGKTPEERIEKLKKRASKLAEPSVELLYNSVPEGTTEEEKKRNKEIRDEQDNNKSRSFVIRTTEKEPELVQTCLDQLLRETNDKGEVVELLEKVFIHAEKVEEAGETKFSFFKSPGDIKVEGGKLTSAPNATASPSFVKSLLNREMRRVFAPVLKTDKDPLPFVIEVNGEGASDPDGKFKSMKIAFTGLSAGHVARINEAVDATVRSFSARPLPDRLENFDSALANETRFRAMWAILASWAAILLYLWFRFGNWTFGLAAVLCLIHDLFFTLGAIAACYFIHGTFIGDLLMIDDFKLDLASVAALLTLVGYSCNDTIVVFDRIREVRGKNPDLTIKMLNDSVNQTLSRTVLASLTVWLVVAVLYWFGGPGVHLFAFVMVIGVIVGTYSSIYIAAPLLLIFGEGKHDEPAPPAAKQPAPTAEGAVV